MKLLYQSILFLGCLPWTQAQKPTDKSPDKDGKYWLFGDGIKAAFIPYGASISDLLIEDQYGITRDVVAGFDNASHYSIDEAHAHLGVDTSNA